MYQRALDRINEGYVPILIPVDVEGEPALFARYIRPNDVERTYLEHRSDTMRSLFAVGLCVGAHVRWSEREAVQ